MSGAYVYRCFDERGVLLYVGCSADWARRLYSHYRGTGVDRSSTEWSRRVGSVSIEHFDTRALAEQAEAIAIRDEGPAFNRRSHPIVRVSPCGCRCTCPAEDEVAS